MRVVPATGSSRIYKVNNGNSSELRRCAGSWESCASDLKCAVDTRKNCKLSERKCERKCGNFLGVRHLVEFTSVGREYLEPSGRGAVNGGGGPGVRLRKRQQKRS
jgi:hypothetical protein